MIPTINQLVRKGRKRKQPKKQNALEGAPLLRGTVLRLFERDPRKPNSANRYCARVRLTNGTEVNCYVPGEREGRIVVQEHAQVLVRRGRVPDLSGVRYRIIRGALDAKGVESRKQGRSKYGAAR